jgi:hypothetical protein
VNNYGKWFSKVNIENMRETGDEAIKVCHLFSFLSYATLKRLTTT